ncbi:MAG: protease, partial [Bacteroidales bacterium]|nr:protease [Bacteroidales bacterium]
MNKLYTFFIAFVFIVFSNYLSAQISSGGLPESFTLKNLTEHFQEVIIPKPDVEKLFEEDLLSDKMSLPLRFAKLLPVGLNLSNSGTWELQKDGSKIWRLKLRSDDAISVSLYYDDFYLPEGAELFLYDDTKKQLKGAFTSINNKENRLFATSMLYGKTVVLELNLPASFTEMSSLQISHLAYAYRDIALNGYSKDVAGSDFCEVNVNCSPEGDNWQEEKKGVVRLKIKIGGGIYWCSGSLINNERSDETPYVLTADHCAFKSGNYVTAADLSQWIFRFKYESATCDGTTGPAGYEIVGATKVAQGGDQGTTGSDFYLLLLDQDIPWEYEPYFNGWSANDTPSSNGVTIHHPSADIKKIST